MWFKEYRDYPIDARLRKEMVESGKGITGCEMHDLNGWGIRLHHYRKPRKGLIARLLDHWFGAEEAKKE